MSEGLRRNRHLPGPPPRLGWPALSSLAATGGSTSAALVTAASPRASKRSRQTGRHQEDVSCSELWNETFAPTCLQDLCIAPKKSKEIATWIEQTALRQHPGKLLVLVGSPGIGKSTMVRLIAKERNMQVAEWNESSSTYQAGLGTDVLSVDQQSPINSFRQFLEQSGVGYQALDLKLLGEYCESQSSRKRKNLSAGQSKTHSDSLSDHSLILLEDLPNLHTPDAFNRFRQIMDQHIRQSVVPTVLIVSDVVEGKCRPNDLERWVSPSLLYSTMVRKIEIHAPTQARFRKALERVATRQGFCLTEEFCEDLHERTGGDVRCAMSTLQFENVGKQRKQAPGSTSVLKRDKKLSTFHALGKLLYAKRCGK
jgi:cell cycle checkpoint protein